MSSGVFLFNEPLKDYWGQKEGQPAAKAVTEGTGDAAGAEIPIIEQEKRIETSNAQSSEQ